MNVAAEALLVCVTLLLAFHLYASHRKHVCWVA
jgi:hypothetical protein